MMRLKSVIYFVQPAEWHTAGCAPIKVGTTAQLPLRIQALANWCPFPLDLLASLPGGRAEERFVLDRFADLRGHGEWMRPALPLLAFVAEAAATHHLPGFERVAHRYGTITNPFRCSRLGALMALHGINSAEIARALNVQKQNVTLWRRQQSVPVKHQRGVVAFFAARGIPLEIEDLFDIPAKEAA